MSRQELADRIKEMREQRSWTQLHLATAAGVSLRTVQRLERYGKCARETLLAVAGAFDIDVRELTSIRSNGEEVKMSHRSLIENLTGQFNHNRLGGRQVLLAGMLYLVLLLGFGAFTAIYWGELYHNQPPKSILAYMNESDALSTYDKDYKKTYEGYSSYFRPVLMGLALYLAVWSAILGLWVRNWLFGLAALAGGGAATVLVLSLMPWMYFPFDQYPLAALWVIGNLLTMAITWLLVTLLGRMLMISKTEIPA